MSLFKKLRIKNKYLSLQQSINNLGGSMRSKQLDGNKNNRLMEYKDFSVTIALFSNYKNKMLIAVVLCIITFYRTNKLITIVDILHNINTLNVNLNKRAFVGILHRYIFLITFGRNLCALLINFLT